jgi:hypothetical protein
MLRLLASNPDVQLKYLEDTDAPECVDELALDYDAIATATQDMVLHDEISEAVRNSAKKINEYLGSFSGHANAYLWTADALHTAEEWKTVCIMAQNCSKYLIES